MPHLILSNYALRLLQHNQERPPASIDAGLWYQLWSVRAETWTTATNEPWQRDLLERGLVQPCAPDATVEQVELRYRRNPLEHIERVVFEYTRVCNLDCQHCRNGHLEPRTEQRPEKLCEAVDLVVPLGIDRFDFIGGEVTLYGARWLRVVEHIRRHPGTKAVVVTNGSFLEEKDFKAAGERFPDDRAYLAHLARAGLTHMVFSLDGPAEIHDAWRHSPGLHDRILRGFERVREAGIEPRVSLVVRRENRGNTLGWMLSVAEKIYGPGLSDEQKLARLTGDEINYVSNFIDVGNAVRLRRNRHDRAEIPDEALRCKNFFRPHPSLRIQATGEVSLCPLIEAGEGYGNVHERSLLGILNGMQDAFIYRLHADNQIASYRRFLDPTVFGSGTDHVCSMRTVLAMIASRIEERGVREEDTGAIHEINVEVARKAGFLPAEGPTANGTRLPY